MEYEIMHRAYCPTKGGRSIPNNQCINDLKERATDYIGTFSEYYPIGLTYSGYGGGVAVAYIRKNWTRSCKKPQHHISLPGFRLNTACSHSDGKLSNHGGAKFSKQDLLRLANAMDEDDTLEIVQTNSELDYIKKAIIKVVKYD